MLYSEMSPEQRKTLLDDPEKYPMKVSFLDKVGILTREELAFLRENGVDFDVDDRQAAEALGEEAVRTAAARRGAQPAHGLLALVLIGLVALVRRLFDR